MKEYKNKKVLVIGLGISGCASVEYLLAQQAQVWGIDANPEKGLHLCQKGMQILPPNTNITSGSFDLVVVSPGIPLTYAPYQQAKDVGLEIIGEIELACRAFNQTAIGVTGTNGKTTVTQLITHILNKSGKSARAVGNIGDPLISNLPKDKNEILVVELSSFQLETLKSQSFDAAVILNITPDHLDRHFSMEEYASAKLKLELCMKPNASFYMEERSYREFGHLLKKGRPKLYGYSPVCDICVQDTYVKQKENVAFILPIEYRGKVSHDVENILAAYALCRELGITSEQFLHALPSFKKAPHRIEFVRKLRGVSFYDDSKGTNIDAVIRAVESLDGEIILIVGGVDKGASYRAWIAPFANKVRHICALGQAAPKIKEELSHAYPINEVKNLAQAVETAEKLAKDGQIVLLSPGCASFDMFRDYKHRGEEFKKLVHALL